MKQVLVFFSTFAALLLYTPHVQCQSKSIAKELSNAFVSVAKEASPAVVYITAEIQNNYGFGYQDDQYDMFGDEFFRRFFGGPPGGGRHRRQAPSQMSLGSGFFISADGYVMTNYHVIKNGTNIKVHLHSSHSERELDAELVGGDPQADIAVLKIKNTNGMKVPFLRFANSNDVQVGEWAIAIGSPLQLESTVTVGVISAKGRQGLQITDLEDFIQTDAAINPGNSGGPLINLDGEVVGINTAIINPQAGYVGIGFAVPSNMAQAIKDQLISDGKITRGFIGVSLQPIDAELQEAFNLPSKEGALVADVLENSPAEKAGLKQGDVIVEVNGRAVRSVSSMQRDIMLTKPGTKVKLGIMRNGRAKTLSVVVGTHKDVVGDSTAVSEELGLSVDNLTPDNIARYHLSEGDQGVVITGIKKGSISHRIGLRPGYLILAVNHEKVSNVREFNAALKKGGDRVLLLVRSGEVVRFFTVKMK